MLPKLEPCAGRAATPTICGRRRRFLVIGGPPPLIYRRAPMPLSVYFFEKRWSRYCEARKKDFGNLNKAFSPHPPRPPPPTKTTTTTIIIRFTNYAHTFTPRCVTEAQIIGCTDIIISQLDPCN